MRICIKCGKEMTDDEALVIWDHCGGIRFICSDCNDVEEDYYDEEISPHWTITEYEFVTCSECGGMQYMGWESTKEAKEKVKTLHKIYKFCPFCGAKMTNIKEDN